MARERLRRELRPGPSGPCAMGSTGWGIRYITSGGLLPVDRPVAPRDLFPVDVVEELRDVVLAPRVVLRERVVRHVADDERIGADPDAALVRVHDGVVPAVVVGVVDEHGPGLRGEGALPEVLLPLLPRAHVLAHVTLDVARRLDLGRAEPREVELVQEDAVRGLDLSTAELAVARGVRRARRQCPF